MVLLQGKGVSKGVVKGPLYFFKRQDNTVTKCIVEDVESEKARFAAAQEAAIEQLTALADRCREEAGDESAILFETHAMFVEDEDMVEVIISLIEEEGCCAEYAVEQAGEQFAEMFAAMDDAYMSARAADVRDVARRLVSNLLGIVEGGIDSDEPVILAGQEQDSCFCYAGWLRKQPYGDSGPHDGHSGDLRPGRCAQGRIERPPCVCGWRDRQPVYRAG